MIIAIEFYGSQSRGLVAWLIGWVSSYRSLVTKGKNLAK